jgi:hypothetical protein
MQRLTDRRALDAHRSRASFRDAFLHEEAALEIEERLKEVNKSFTAPVTIGIPRSPIAALFPGAPVLADLAEIAGAQGAHDLAIHALALHWADDPVGQLVQSRLLLQPDGLFIGAIFAGQTLHELRAALAETESRLTGGLSPRVLPMADLRDLGGLMQRAGFALPVADSRRLTVRYPDLAALVRDLRAMGETNALDARDRRPLSRDFFRAAEETYRAHFSDKDGYLIATFEIVFLTGWAPEDSQPKPLRPGSAQTRLADALGTREHTAGEPVAPRRR